MSHACCSWNAMLRLECHVENAATFPQVTAEFESCRRLCLARTSICARSPEDGWHRRSVEGRLARRAMSGELMLTFWEWRYERGTDGSLRLFHNEEVYAEEVVYDEAAGRVFAQLWLAAVQNLRIEAK